MDRNKFVQTILKTAFVRMENVWDLLFQIMEHWTNTLHVAFIFLFSVHKMQVINVIHGVTNVVPYLKSNECIC
jgi:hypothetical protein